MDYISINDLHDIYSALNHDGYNLFYAKNGLYKFKKGKDIKEITLNDYLENDLKLIKPDFENSILNLDASICKYYGKASKYKTHKVVDEILSKKLYKHIAILVLDGMGSYGIRKNLSEDSCLAKSKVCDLVSMFPSTTACSIPATISGLEPGKTGWVGWANYFDEVNKDVVMFKNTDYFTDEKVEINVNKLLPYTPFYHSFDTFTFSLSSVGENHVNSINELCDKYLDEIKKHDQSFAYLYYSEPDSTTHICGSYDPKTKEQYNKIDEAISKLKANLPSDTIVFVTSDHGHIDVKPIYLANFTDILNTLSRLPSNEGRCAFFKIKRFYKMRFVRRFKRYFGSYFELLTKKEFIEQGYLGPNKKRVNKRIDSFIGDYVAIATKQYYFNFDDKTFNISDDKMPFKSHHAGLTANEMMIPLVVLEKN